MLAWVWTLRYLVALLERRESAVAERNPRRARLWPAVETMCTEPTPRHSAVRAACAMFSNRQSSMTSVNPASRWLSTDRSASPVRGGALPGSRSANAAALFATTKAAAASVAARCATVSTSAVASNGSLVAFDGSADGCSVGDDGIDASAVVGVGGVDGADGTGCRLIAVERRQWLFTTSASSEGKAEQRPCTRASASSSPCAPEMPPTSRHKSIGTIGAGCTSVSRVWLVANSVWLASASHTACSIVCISHAFATANGTCGCSARARSMMLLLTSTPTQ
mmetsp:Transcript_49691/g.106176  ORF Transcript_49691/g.106176 Transcript_49691/m.106176 type:complete len:280 (-) Transcript_49691:301-1140(-)